MSHHKMPLPTTKRALELAASFLEIDLDRMRSQAVAQYEHQQRIHGSDWDGREFPIGSSHEGDLMKAVEWAYAAATLRALARAEA